MGVDGDLYKLVLVLHILSAIIGFGGMFIAGFYGDESRRLPGGEGLVVAKATMKVSGQVPTIAVCAVPVFGILLVLMSDDLWKFSQAWISLSFLLYIVLMGLATGLQVPTLRKLVALRAAGGNATEVEALGKRAAAIGAVVNVLWIITLAIMVFKPGYP